MKFSPKLVFGILLLSFSAGCATLPKDFQAKVSTSISQDTSSTLANFVQPESLKHPHQSGFLILNEGRQAYLSRLALAEAAEHTIDCQYFIWNGDSSGLILMQRLLKAAERGVRVRLLLDDMTTHGKDLGLAVLNQQPNIQIRLFNPLGRRYYVGLFRTLSMVFHAGRMTNRMHNKIFVGDNQVAILGGRNIGDEYFGLDKRSNFRDLDLMAIGPVVNDISRAFDDYWNSPWSVPFEIFKTHLPSQKKQAKMKEKLNRNFEKMEQEFPYPLEWHKDRVLENLSSIKKDLIWGPAEVVCDPPGKAWKKATRGAKTSEIASKFENLGQGVKNDIIIVSPYFIVANRNIDQLGETVKRGVSIRVLTNSLSSTDAVPVVAMYRKSRKRLLQNGVQLHEIRPDAAARKIYITSPESKARLSLHAKLVIMDRTQVFVGSFNIDPRSEYLNTEVGLLVDSPELGARLSSLIESDLSTKNSYELFLKGRSVEWNSEENNGTKTFTGDPLAGPWLRFEAWFLGLLPISSQL